jgi:excisionase family DNA binding protein
MARVLTTAQAVREFGMHPITVLRLIQTQRVAAEKDRDGRWLIRRSDLEAWNHRRAQRAPKQAQESTVAVAT